MPLLMRCYIQQCQFLIWWKGSRLSKVDACHSPVIHHSIQWSRPPVGFLKCNFDDSSFSSQNIASFGIIIHNSDGKFVAVKNSVLHCSMNPALAEALSCREALSWLKETWLKLIV